MNAEEEKIKCKYEAGMFAQPSCNRLNHQKCKMNNICLAGYNDDQRFKLVCIWCSQQIFLIQTENKKQFTDYPDTFIQSLDEDILRQQILQNKLDPGNEETRQKIEEKFKSLRDQFEYHSKYLNNVVSWLDEIEKNFVYKIQQLQTQNDVICFLLQALQIETDVEKIQSIIKEISKFIQIQDNLFNINTKYDYRKNLSQTSIAMLDQIGHYSNILNLFLGDMQESLFRIPQFEFQVKEKNQFQTQTQILSQIQSQLIQNTVNFFQYPQEILLKLSPQQHLEMKQSIIKDEFLNPIHFVKHSDILSCDQWIWLLLQLNRTPQKLQPIFDQSIDGLISETFNAKCSQKAFQIIIIQTQLDAIFGFYTPSQWNKDSVNWKDDSTNTSFIFSVNKKTIHKLIQTNKKHFLGGKDFILQVGCSNNTYIAYDIDLQKSDLQSSSSMNSSFQYNGVQDQDKYLAGEQNFQIKQLVVFEILEWH